MKKTIRRFAVVLMVAGIFLLAGGLVKCFFKTTLAQQVVISVPSQTANAREPVIVTVERVPEEGEMPAGLLGSEGGEARATLPANARSNEPVSISVEPRDHEPISISVEPKSNGPVTITVDSAIDPLKPMVALTFDDGPGPRTGEILNLLEHNGGRATFFLVGTMANANQETVGQIAALGCEIGNHSWQHKSLSGLSYQSIVEDVEKTSRLIQEVTGVRPALLRPPYGNKKGSVLQAAKDLDLSVILWSIDTLDWKTRSSWATYEAIMNQVKDGSIVLCHDIHNSTIDAMYQVIPALKERGYQLVTVSELLKYKYGVQTPGKVYYHGYASEK